MKRLGLVIDTNLCIGCQSCVVACKTTNLRPELWTDYDKSRIRLESAHACYPPTTDVGRPPSDKRIMATIQCMHCDNAPCIVACPTGATYRRPDGIVAIDRDRCLGCGYCIDACPYGARYLDSEAGTVDKCNLCAELVDQGQDPACVTACPTGARVFGDLNDPSSAVSGLLGKEAVVQLKAQLGTQPKVYYVPPAGVDYPFEELPTSVPPQKVPSPLVSVFKQYLKPLTEVAVLGVIGLGLIQMVKSRAEERERRRQKVE